MFIAKEHGLYVINPDFFSMFPNADWLFNKERGRPTYYSFRDSDGLLWMIPISTKVEEARPKIAKAEARYGAGNCLFYHIGIIAGQERVFRISKLFPISEKYIDHEYTISAIHYIVKTGSLNDELEKKAKTFIALVEQGKLQSDCNILEIKKYLLAAP